MLGVLLVARPFNYCCSFAFSRDVCGQRGEVRVAEAQPHWRYGQDMAKERKTAHELEVLIFNEARKARECEGMTGVTVREIVDPRVDYNWSVSHAHNATPMCERIIVNIETRLQKLYDLAD